MLFPSNHFNNLLQNKLKRLKQVLTKRSLQRNQGPNSRTFLLKYFISHNCPSYNFLPNDNYYAQVVISKQPDF